ncbi:hypothetical protein [Streptomyces sp. NPDC005548]|uniref:3'-5' exonuclease n=1 Tax=Streptomyces sp. NPDC005548 TaxID=3364724 RepID=UPI0036916A29
MSNTPGYDAALAATERRPAICFVDTETTGLNPDVHDVWEIAIIKRCPGGPDWEHHWQIRPTELHLAQSADPKALEIGRYYQRMALPNGCHYAQLPPDGTPVPVTRTELLETVTYLLKNSVMVGSNPAFDAAFLNRLLDASPWHYRTVDIATLAAGYVQGLADATQYPDGTPTAQLPYSSRGLSTAVGVEPPGPDTAHTALGDARWARDVYDAVTKPAGQP